MKLHGKNWVLELSDLIRVNQLVRDRIDFDRFSAWYQELNLQQQQTLTRTLFEFAYQAGVKDDLVEAACDSSGLAGTATAERFRSFHPQENPDFWGMYCWIERETGSDLFSIFKLFVFLFGLAEGRVYRAETKENCNHWWHRNLLDERVVRDLLSNPQFYSTSMKDDEIS